MHQLIVKRLLRKKKKKRISNPMRKEAFGSFAEAMTTYGQIRLCILSRFFGRWGVFEKKAMKKDDTAPLP